VFGATTNAKGYKVITGAGVIQGDGINITTLKAILDAVLAEGYSAQSVAFGMGGGLLQKVNRDTCSFATKLSHIVYGDGRAEDVMKQPQTDAGKFSLPGEARPRGDTGCGGWVGGWSGVGCGTRTTALIAILLLNYAQLY
jgi:nicotinamide phosphoribosyltransferase